VSARVHPTRLRVAAAWTPAWPPPGVASFLMQGFYDSPWWCFRLCAGRLSFLRGGLGWDGILREGDSFLFQLLGGRRWRSHARWFGVSLVLRQIHRVVFRPSREFRVIINIVLRYSCCHASVVQLTCHGYWCIIVVQVYLFGFLHGWHEMARLSTK